MGYYKRLYSGDIRRSNSRSSKLRKAVASGNPIDINITVDIEKLVKEFERVGKYKGLKKDQIKAIHVKVGESGARAIKKVIVDYPRTIQVRRSGRYGGRPGEPVDVQPGTLKRSIGVIDPGNGTNVWVGPRSSAVANVSPYSRKDGWFAHIVNEGDQFLGPGPNRNFFERGLQRGTRNMEAMLVRMHKTLIGKHVDG